MKKQRPFAIFISSRGIEFTSMSQSTSVEESNLVCYVDSKQAGLRIAQKLASDQERKLFYQF
ncbi:hypothetical protein [Crocosphaera chwakensis]|uniref:Uncharacterized protein n=1 Tax=Crocosphaera chwakensis CCY0110 TaxID=391612 RepID=A3IXJ9_9CHRO|nr:hypothetical protein [Crocosphaera chwakensis]EAZ88801.1 hypothetical protein CY0110_01070 [Crocosphaera chwakensis CCY0110]